MRTATLLLVSGTPALAFNSWTPPLPRRALPVRRSASATEPPKVVVPDLPADSLVIASPDEPTWLLEKKGPTPTAAQGPRGHTHHHTLSYTSNRYPPTLPPAQHLRTRRFAIRRGCSQQLRPAHRKVGQARPPRTQPPELSVSRRVHETYADTQARSCAHTRKRTRSHTHTLERPHTHANAHTHTHTNALLSFELQGTHSLAFENVGGSLSSTKLSDILL